MLSRFSHSGSAQFMLVSRGIYAWHDLLQAEVERSRRSGRPLTVLFKDIDNCKRFNVTCGHKAGDDLVVLTLSIGVANLPDHSFRTEELNEFADQAMYSAKQSGRNRTVSWSEFFNAQPVPD